MATKPKNHNNPLTKMDIYLKLSVDPKLYVRSALSENPEINDEIQGVLLKDTKGPILRGLAGNPSLSTDSMVQLLKILESDSELGDFIIQGFFAAAKLSQNVVKLITGERYASGDFMAIKSSALSASEKQVCLKRMINNANWLQDAASCDALNEKQIELFLNHKDEIVRAGLARNPIITEEAQLKFAKDQSTDVRQGLALNPALTDQAIKLLAKDKDSRVTDSLEHNLRKRKPHCVAKKPHIDYAKLLKSGSEKDLIGVALDAYTPTDIISQLCQKCHPDYDNWISVALAQNQKISKDIIKNIAKSKNSSVLEALAANPLTELDTLWVLSKNKSYNVRAIVANPSWFLLPPFMAQ